MQDQDNTSQAKENVENFLKRYVQLLKDKKLIDEDIQALKEEFKEEGVAVNTVVRVFNQVKRQKKKTDSQIFEEEVISDWIENNTDIDDAIGELNAKA